MIKYPMTREEFDKHKKGLVALTNVSLNQLNATSGVLVTEKFQADYFYNQQTSTLELNHVKQRDLTHDETSQQYFDSLLSTEPPVEIKEIEVPAEAQGSGSERGWDTGFAQDGDPYGIQKEYVSQSASPNAAIPENKFVKPTV